MQQIAVPAFPRLYVMGREELVRSRFVEGLVPGPLREHFLRSPPIDTPDLKRTTLRFLAADKLANLSDAHPPSVMTVERATESSGLDSFQRTMTVADFSSRDASRGQPSLRWNKRPAWSNYHGRQSECIHCKRFGRHARDAATTVHVNQVSGVFVIYLMFIMSTRLGLGVERKTLR
ncbi:unnamed protein product [Schistosoma margrebowiei]|uniref:Uncharacterized protein n=1 Tax=Schistosoma margrebowiei TaxID=48269 RepID=A0A183LNJ5_9TREM|nr:unnamed protein product [Schistosoma margrebowiei]